MIVRLCEKFDNKGVYEINYKGFIKKIIVLPKTSIIVKYADNNGQFRFYPFYENYKENLNVKNLGNVMTKYNNLYDIGKNYKNLGFEAENTLTFYTDADMQAMEKLKWLFVSPLIFLKYKNKDWINVILQDSNYTVNKVKGNRYNIEVVFKIPDFYTLKNI